MSPQSLCRRRLHQKYASGDLEFEPDKFVYDNSGYFLLGAIIEKVTGKPYDQVLKENIFDPVGMKTAVTTAGDDPQQARHRYTRTPRGYQTAAYLDMSILMRQVRSTQLWKIFICGTRPCTARRSSLRNPRLMFKPNLNSYGYGFVITKATLAPPTKLAVPVIQHNGGIMVSVRQSCA